MDADRYRKMSLEALGRLARASRADEAVLEGILNDLSQRYSHGARELRQRVERYLNELQSGVRPPEVDGSKDQGVEPVGQSPERNEFGMADESDVELIRVLERMRERLLDLTNRNALLNYRHPKTRSVRVVDEVPALIFSRLLSQGPMVFAPLDVADQADLPGLDLTAEAPAQEKRARQEEERIRIARRMGIDPAFDLPSVGDTNLPEHADNKLQTLLKPHELEKLLHTLYRDSITAVQESGANMLHLMLGFVEWQDVSNGAVEQAKRIAPLVLLPVSLSRGDLDAKTRTYRYSVSPTGEDWSPNVALQVKCRKEFGFELPSVEVDDDSLEAYFARVEAAIAGLEGWRLRRFVTLGLVSFGKILMWRDLDATKWPKKMPLLGNKVFRQILGEADDSPPPGDPIVSEYPIDSLPPEEGVHLPLVTDADSSQHSVLVDVRRGRNLVVQGPPGTGKSQTITNLIGDALSRGKKVLFVAEKKAALDVVAKRLREAGLGPFCLALHSHTSQKREFLDDLLDRLNVRGNTRPPGDLVTTTDVVDELRTELNLYAERLHHLFGAIQRTPFEILWRVRRLCDALGPGTVAALTGLHVESPEAASAGDLARNRTAMDRYSASFRRVAPLDRHPWVGVENPAMTHRDVEESLQIAAGWRESLAWIRTETLECIATVGEEIPTSPRELNDLVAGARAVAEPSSRVPAETPVAIVTVGTTAVEAAVIAVETARAAWAKIPGPWGVRGLVSAEEADHFQMVLEFGTACLGGACTPSDANAAAQKLDAAARDTRSVALLLERLQSAVGLESPRTARVAGRWIRAVESLRRVDDAALQLRSPAMAAPDARERLEELAKRAAELQTEAERLDGRFHRALRPDIGSLRDHVVALSTAPKALPWLFSGRFRAAVAAYRAMTGGERVSRDTMVSGMRELLSHLLAVEEFNASPALSDLFGEHARGIASPFDRAFQLLDWYAEVVAICSGLGEAGRNLEAALWNGSISSWREAEAIQRAEAATAELARGLDQALQALGAGFLQWPANLSERPLGEVERELLALAARLREVVGVGESAAAPSATIDELIRRLMDLRAAWAADRDLEQFAKLFSSLGVPFAGPDTDIVPICDALAFLHSVGAANLPRGIQRWLISVEPAVRVRHLKHHAERIARALDVEMPRRSAFRLRVTLREPTWLAGYCRTATELQLAPVEDVLARLAHALSAPEALHEWAAFVHERANAVQLRLGPFCDCVERGLCPPEVAADAYEYALFRGLADAVFRSLPGFNVQSGERLQVTRAGFAAYDEKWIGSVRSQLAHELNQSPPHPGISFGAVAQLTDEALIRHEANKIRRHLPIREVFRRAGAAIQAMKPCFLMGPQAVAQYLAPGLFQFDIVVMDEASQMRPEDALGAIARGQQLVVVGDPKQLGPTRFFERLQDDEDEELEEAAGLLQWNSAEVEGGGEPPQGVTVLERSESILNAAAARYPTRLLRWHYRSRHPKLIAFSNREFYHENLIIFPGHGGNDGVDGVFFRSVAGGLYEPRARRNVPEVHAVVEAVRQHARDFPERSLLVATLNSTQAELIDAHLQEVEKEDVELSAFRRRHQQTLEPFVVKNLENVQGDERDTIYVSITFGRNVDGQLHQQFGPIGLKGGERRLNVLFTRAKHRLEVFCSFDPSDLRVAADSSAGLQTLQQYLYYAQGAQWALGRENGRAPDSDFEIAVAGALAARGHEVRCQVGVAGYFIDLGVVHPQHPGRFILGVECDGATYHSARSARDRDRLREMVLTREFHWAIHRVWSTDWFRDPVTEVNRIEAAIRARLDDEEPGESIRPPPTSN